MGLPTIINHLNSSYLSFFNKFLFSAIAVFLFFGGIGVQDSYAQPETLEATVNSVSDASVLGPATSLSFNLLRNEDNPGTSTYSTYFPQTTVTITLDNFNASYTPLQAGNPTPLSFGWFVNTVDTGEPTYIDNTYLVNGDEDFLFTSLNYISDPADGNYTATDAGSTGDGIDIGTNYGAFLVASLSGLQNEPLLSGGIPIDYDLADLTIEFSQPLTDPVLHFMGLGAEWVAQIQNEAETVTQNYRNSATVEFDLIDSETNFVDGDASDVTLSVLGGSVLLAIEDTDKIVNIADDPGDRFDYDGPSSGGGSADTDGAAHGSVLVTGEDITGLTFRVYVRAGTGGLNGAGADEGFGWAGNSTAWTFDPDGVGGASAEPVHYQVTGGNPVVNDGELQLLLASDADGDDPLLQYYFAEDAFMISVSTELEADEVELTEGDSYRMLTSPIAGTSYNDLIGELWTQGSSQGLGYNTDAGDPNIFTWPLGDAESSGWTSGFDLNNVIPTGEGFLMTVFEADDYESGTGSFPKTLSLTGSEVEPPIEVNDGGGDSDGWLLLGNPFKDPIDISFMLNNRISNLEEVIYVWDRGIGAVDDPGREPGWRFSALGADPTNPDSDGNPMLGNIDNDVLMPFQGFFIQKSGSANSSVTFDDGTEGSRDDITTTTTGTFYRKEKVHPNVIVLNLKGESLSNSLWLTFSDYGSIERLSNDALELASLNQNYALISTKKNDGDLLTLSQLPIPNEDFEIPVSIESTIPGNYTITASDFNLSIPYDLYLIDLEEGDNIKIDENLKYIFTINQAAKANPTPIAALKNGPKKAKTSTTSDRFVIATQPRDFAEIPASVALNQNYPNPFNPTTQISYELPQTADVRLEVYDLVGRQVASLVNQTMEAGAHTVNFDASNLSSGVYIYRLNAGNTVLSRKLTVIK